MTIDPRAVSSGAYAPPHDKTSPPPVSLLPKSGIFDWLRWRHLSPADRLQVITVSIRLAAFVIAIGALWSVRNQLRINDQTHRTAIRGQLYQTESGLVQEEGEANDHIRNSLWALVPASVGADRYAAALLSLITSDSTTLHARSAHDLHWAITGLDAMADANRRRATMDLRKLFLYTQANLYHTHSAHDYHLDGILKDGEWDTWRGYVREMHAHPILMVTIYHGYVNRYFSQDFAAFLQQELCGRVSRTTGIRETLAESMQRDCAFAQRFYPEMFRTGWKDALATY